MNSEIGENCRFSLHKVEANGRHDCVTKEGFPYFQLRFIHRGAVSVNAGEMSFSAAEGDVLLLPPDIPYALLWSGEPRISFTVLEFTLLSLLSRPEPAFLHAPELEEDFRALRENEKEEKYARLSRFFALLAKTLPRFGGKAPRSPIAPALERIGENLAAPFLVSDLAALCALSESRFFTLFKEETGLSPIDYRNRKRAEQADFLLSEGFSVAEVSERLGFASPSYFRRIYKKYAKPGLIR